jgi:diacylglycerol kinase
MTIGEVPDDFVIRISLFPAMSRSWKQKFADAFRGLHEGIRGGSSFVAHLAVAAGVLAAAAALRMDTQQRCLLVMCIAAVLAAEMFNSALESLARAITTEENPHIRDALDIASGAVLTAAFGASAVGVLLFGHRAGQLLGWW